MSTTKTPPLHPQTEYILEILVAAGHIKRETAFQASDIAREFVPNQASGLKDWELQRLGIDPSKRGSQWQP